MATDAPMPAPGHASCLFGGIADDLTGGLEMAAMLVAQGVDCLFVTDPDELSTADTAPAMVIAQKTRVIAAAEAVAKSEKAARALLAAGARQLFFKYCATFDSTDKGNIGPVSDRLMRLTGAPYTAFCPASPPSGRTVYNGHLFVGSELVSESPKRHDPLTPMTDPDLVRVLQRQTALKVGLLPHTLVSRGPARLRDEVARLAAQGTRYFITDTIYDGDLAAIAALVGDWPLMTGNATIVQHYPPQWRALGLLPADGGQAAPPPVRGPGVVLSGSCAERTLEQLAAFEAERPVLRMDLLAVADPATAIAEALDWALPRLENGPVAIATSASPHMVASAQQKYGREGAAQLAETVIGGLAVGLHDAGARRFVVAGGETSGAVVEHLGIRRLRVGPYVGPGIGTATTMGDDPSAFCLKSGKLGAADLMLTMLNAMQRGDA